MHLRVGVRRRNGAAARRPPSLVLGSLFAVGALLHAACVSYRVSVADRPQLEDGAVVETPVRAHLEDGRIALFRDGFTLRQGELRGTAELYDALLAPQGTSTAVPLDDVVAFESYESQVENGKTIVFSLLAAAATAVGAAALAAAVFGSCPTVYAGTDLRLEAELFSYSIAPLFEGRDLDALAGRPDASGRLVLEVRNEALETHYINHLSLAEVTHAPGERALPDQDGRAVVVGSARPVRRATDRGGRDWTQALAVADGRAYASPEAELRAAAAPGREGDLDDWIELDLDVPEGEGQPALVVTARNSLLVTVLFYETMLARSGVGAIDWLGRDLGQISTAVEIGRWISASSGLRVEVWRGGAWERVARLPDPGPIAWRGASVGLPPLPPGPARVRLAFLADGWRLDQVAIGRSRPAEVRMLRPAEVRGGDGRRLPEILQRLAEPDQEYLVTYPGQRVSIAFDAGPPPPGPERSFLLSSQGHYVEWVRGDWVRRAGRGVPFAPTQEALQASLRRWSEVRSDFERDFFATRIPVR